MSRRLLMVTAVLALAVIAIVGVTQTGQAAPILNPAVDLSKPNFAYSPPLRKFVDRLPGLTSAGTNSLGQFIPIAVADTLTYPGSDYYEIALVEYREQMHSDLPPLSGPKTSPTTTGGTKLRGYVQEINGVPVTDPHYLGPIIIATKNVPVRIKFTNRLPLTGSGGDLFLPVDTTIMGAGMGPKFANGADCDPANEACAEYTQNRATIHLHGGLPPWISDGTAHQWITPGGEATPYKKGASQQNVPDMGVQPDGSATFYWPNQQGGRLMFYHDHALGLTGPNVYAGEAAGYLLVDPAEESMLTAVGVPTDLIPLIIQDKSFVYDSSVTPVGVAQDPTRFTSYTDPLWDPIKWGVGGDLWAPHVYVPNQDPTDISGANSMGRWDYGPWFWPVFPVDAPYPPTVSHVPEAFMDTPVVNGTAYPYVEVAPQAYRLRILNAMNDRMVNLQFYVADSGYTTPAIVHATVSQGRLTVLSLVDGGSGYTPNSTPMVHIVGGGGYGAWAIATVNESGVVASVDITKKGADYTSAPAVFIGGDTEVKMVPAQLNDSIPFPDTWLAQTPGMIPDILDGRLSGVPDPTKRGPAMIQIGTEGGLLPGPALLTNIPVGFEQNKRNIVVLNVLEKTLFMGPAERADVIVDFSAFAGKTIIMYNDAPAPVPAGDPRYDFYTGNPDYSATGGANDQGGAPSTLPGYGPNTRTIAQFRVSGSSGAATPDYYNPALLSALTTSLPAIFKATVDAPVVPESVYNSIGYTGGAATDTYARISDTTMTFTPYGSTTPVTMTMKKPTIQELFDPLGRMNATLGVELQFTGALIQTTVPLGFIDPTTETLKNGETQIWKLTHNGVDTHPIHFHLVNVQVINRVGWDGAIRPPDENERGWKETVRMSPLEDIIVAMRAKTPTYPFSVPDSIRPLNPAMPVGSTFASLDPKSGQPITVTNAMTNFGHEYTWHCHILGHEENDMMRPMVLNMNGVSNILWSDSSSGAVAIWIMDGITQTGYKDVGTAPAGWAVAGVGDFNGDGNKDILWRNTSDGAVAVWLMSGTTQAGFAFVGGAPLSWQIIGVGDFNADNSPDILWQDTSTGDIAIWTMNGTTQTGFAQVGSAPLTWQLRATGDLNNDGKLDLLWTDTATGTIAVWYMDGTTQIGFDTLGTVPANNALVAIGDFNNDVYPDILWRDTTTGAITVWYMKGIAKTGSASLGSAPLSWQIVGVF